MDPDEAPRKDIKLEEIMKPAVSLPLDAPAREALKIMREHNVPGVPVVGEDARLEGFITDGQLMASALPRYMQLMDNLSFVPERTDKCGVHPFDRTTPLVNFSGDRM
jgi:CBS-domain-containing membrane protein